MFPLEYRMCRLHTITVRNTGRVSRIAWTAISTVVLMPAPEGAYLTCQIRFHVPLAAQPT